MGLPAQLAGRRVAVAVSRGCAAVCFCGCPARPSRYNSTQVERDIEKAPPERESGSREEYRSREERGGREGRRPDAARRREAVLIDAAVFRAIAYRDVVQTHFDGHPYAAKRSLERMRSEGLVEIVKARGPRGGTFLAVVATDRGRQRADRALWAARRQERAWHGQVKRREAAHDCAVYKAVVEAIETAGRDGGTVRRIRTETELKSLLARASEKARADQGREAADRARREMARDLGLPVSATGKVSLPDAQVEILERDGVTVSIVAIEVVSDKYKASQVAAKAAAGFQLSAMGPASAGRIAAAGASGGGGSGKSPRGDDPALLEL